MGSEVTEQTTAPVAAPEPAAPKPTVDDFTALLSEFETATAKPAAEPVKAEPATANAYDELLSDTTKPVAAPPEKPDDPVAEAIKQTLDQGAITDQLKAHLGHYAGLVEQMQAKEVQRQAQADFESIVARADKMIQEAGYAVGADYARRWITAEAMLNPALREAFDNRHQSPQHLRRAEKMVGKAMERLLGSAKAEPDREVTSDKLAVAAAVRGASYKLQPEAPVRYGDLTDAEFKAELKKYGL